jgi:hypothetical protein
LSLALVSWKVNPSDVPDDFIGVPDGSVAVQVVPLVLVSVAVLVPVPLWYVATTESVLARFTVVQVNPAGRRVFRVRSISEMMFKPSPATETEQLPVNAGAPMIVSDLLGTAWLPGTVAVKGIDPPLEVTTFLIDVAGILTLKVPLPPVMVTW